MVCQAKSETGFILYTIGDGLVHAQAAADPEKVKNHGDNDHRRQRSAFALTTIVEGGVRCGGRDGQDALGPPVNEGNRSAPAKADAPVITGLRGLRMSK